MFVFRTARPIAAFKLGEDISGLTAGRGRAGAGEADRRIAGEEPNEERRLEAVGGGSIGIGMVMGVPGFEGAGEAMARPPAALADECLCNSAGAGAGLCVDIRRPGRSILLNLPCV